MPMLTTEEFGATEILKQEHQRIKDLFRQFEDAASDRQKKTIGDAALREIEAQTCLSEEVFYPAVRRQLGERQRVVQAEAAHEVAKVLIKELKGLSAGEHYNARFDLLKTNVRQQIEEAESELLPRVEKSDIDLEQLGRDMLELKVRLAQSDTRMILRRTGVAALSLVAVGAVAWFVSSRNSFRDRY